MRGVDLHIYWRIYFWTSQIIFVVLNKKDKNGYHTNNMKNIFLVVLAASWFFPILTLTLPNHHQLKWQEDIDKLLTRALIDNDFESGSTSPWFDESPANVKWRVEDVSSPLEVDSPAPKPATGTSYLRATRNADLSAGLAVFSSPVFTANPGDKVSFDFWIRSRRTGGNNLEVWRKPSFQVSGIEPTSNVY